LRVAVSTVSHTSGVVRPCRVISDLMHPLIFD
jgi:hypothetical protein